MKHLTLSFAFLSLFVSSLSITNAVDIPGDYAPTGGSQCIDLKNNLIITSRDARTNNEVTTLQEFLQERGYLESDPTGYFGYMTKAAVIKYQRSVPLAGTGYVGPLTRAEIKRVSCNGIATVPGPIMCTQEMRFCPNGSAMPRSTTNCAWQPEKCSSATTTSQIIKSSNSNSANGPWIQNGSIYNSGPIYNKITGVTKSKNPKICIASAVSNACQSISGYRAVTASEWLNDNTIQIITQGGTSANGSYATFINYPGEQFISTGSYYLMSLPPSHSWACVVPGPVTVNTAPYSCSGANAGTSKRIDGYDCYCNAAQYINTGIATSTISQNPTTPTTPSTPTTPDPNATCKYKTLDGNAPFTNVVSQCTLARNGQFAEGSTNLYCSCNGYVMSAPASTLGVLVANGVSGSLGTSAYNSGKIYVRTTGLVKANKPKGCMSPAGSSGCLVPSNQREYTADEWVNDTTTMTSIDGGTIPNGSYDSYVAYPNKTAVKIGTVSLIAGQPSSPTTTTTTTTTTNVWGGVSNSASGPWVVTAPNYGKVYSQIHGLNRSANPKGCAQSSGTSVCQNAANYRDFTSSEWVDATTVRTVVDGGTIPNGAYDSYIMYPNQPAYKAFTVTLSAPVVKTFVSNSSNGPWFDYGPVMNSGSIYTRTINVFKERGPKGCATPAQSGGCTSLSAFRDFTASEWIDNNTIQTVLPGGSIPNGYYDVYIAYPGENQVRTGYFLLSGSQGFNDSSAGEGLSQSAKTLALNVLQNISKQVNDGFTLINSLSGSTSVLASSPLKECVTVSRNLHRGDESVQTTKLQQFLIDKGFLSEKASGFFGDFTIAAVKTYQGSVGLPQTGMVYDLTRQAISAETCN